MTEGNQAWAEPALEIDEQAERGVALADQEIRVLARANRLALRCDPAVRHAGQEPGTQLLDFPLRCVAHAHPECRFRWVRVTLNLAETDGAYVTDLSPRDEVSEHPVKVTTTYCGGLKFDIAALPVHPELAAERATEQDVFFPKVSVSGTEFGYALWDFTAVGEEPLKVDRPLRLLAAVPAAPDQVPVQLTLRALVTARGVAGRIPLIGRQTTTIPLATSA